MMRSCLPLNLHTVTNATFTGDPTPTQLSATGTITEMAPIEYSLSSTTTTYTEGDGMDGEIAFTITASSTPTRAVVLFNLAPGGATHFLAPSFLRDGANIGGVPVHQLIVNLADWTAEADGSATYSAGRIPIAHDHVYESDGDLTLRILSGSLALPKAGASSFTVTVMDNDTPAVRIETEATVIEGADTGFRLQMFNAAGTAVSSATPVAVSYAIASDSTAADPADYTSAVPSGRIFNLTSETNNYANVIQTRDDAIIEPDKTIVLEFSTSTAGVTFAGSNTTSTQVTITLVDNDPTVSLRSFNHATENDGTIDFVISLNAAADLTVSYATSDSPPNDPDPALAGRDYEAQSGTVTFMASGGTTATVAVLLINDDITPKS